MTGNKPYGPEGGGDKLTPTYDSGVTAALFITEALGDGDTWYREHPDLVTDMVAERLGFDPRAADVGQTVVAEEYIGSSSEVL